MCCRGWAPSAPGSAGGGSRRCPRGTSRRDRSHGLERDHRFQGATVGEISVELRLRTDLPLGELGTLLVPGIVVALVGFAEPASIARRYAAEDRRPWDSNREFVRQGLANIASGVAGGLSRGWFILPNGPEPSRRGAQPMEWIPYRGHGPGTAAVLPRPGAAARRGPRRPGDRRGDLAGGRPCAPSCATGAGPAPSSSLRS